MGFECIRVAVSWGHHSGNRTAIRTRELTSPVLFLQIRAKFQFILNSRKNQSILEKKKCFGTELSLTMSAALDGRLSTGWTAALAPHMQHPAQMPTS